MEFIIKGAKTPASQELFDYLDSLPDGVLLGKPQLIESNPGIKKRVLEHRSQYPGTDDYCYVHPNVATLWGSKKTVAAYKRMLNGKKTGNRR